MTRTVKQSKGSELKNVFMISCFVLRRPIELNECSVIVFSCVFDA